MADTTASAGDHTTLEQALNRTDLGHWLFEHRKSFIAAVLVAFVLLSGIFLYRQYSEEQARTLAAEAFKLEATELVALKEGKLEAEAFIAKVKSLSPGALASVAMVPVALDAASHLASKGDHAGALQLFELVVPQQLKARGLAAVVVTPFAAALEKNGKATEAKQVWHTYLASGDKVLVPRAYLELGRLSLQLNDRNDAKKNLDYLVANHPNDELTKLARLLLQELTP